MTKVSHILNRLWKNWTVRELSKEQVAEPMFKINPEKYKAYYKIDQQDIFRTRPNVVVHESRQIKCNDTYYRGLYVIGYPSRIKAGFVSGLITAKLNFDVAFDIEKLERGWKTKQLEQSRNNIQIEFDRLRKKGTVSSALEDKDKNVEAARTKLQTGDEKPFRLGVCLAVKANNIDDLDAEEQKAIALLGGMGMEVARADMENESVIRALLPNTEFPLTTTDHMTTTVEDLFPFTDSFLEGTEGIIWGVNKATENPIIFDAFSGKLTNMNMVVCGGSGSGKSYSSSAILMRYLQKGARGYILDPNDEYGSRVERFEGQLIVLSGKEGKTGTMPNCLELMGMKRGQKVESLKIYFSIKFPDITPPQMALLFMLIDRVYDRYNIGLDFDPKENPGKEMPELKDLYIELRDEMDRISSEGKNPTQTHYIVLNMLKPFAVGAYSYMSNKHKIDWTNELVCFSIQDIPESLKGALMFLILEMIKGKMEDSREAMSDDKIIEALKNFKGKSVEELFEFSDKLQNQQRNFGWIWIDEGWRVLNGEGSDNYIELFSRTARKYDYGICVITQSIGDLLATKGGNALIDNSAIALLLKQKAKQIADAKRTYTLSDEEGRILNKAGKGEGILIVDDERYHIQSLLTEEEAEAAESKKTKRWENIVKQRVEYEEMKSKIISFGIKKIKQTELKEYKRLINKTSHTKEDKKIFNVLQETIIKFGRDELSNKLQIKFDKLHYIHGSSEADDVVKEELKTGKQGESVQKDIVRDERNWYSIEEINQEETHELKKKGFAYVSYPIGNSQKAEFYMRFFEFKKRDKLIDPDKIAVFQNNKQVAIYLKKFPREADKRDSFLHQSLIYLTEYLLKKKDVVDVKVEDESIYPRPDVYFVNKNKQQCVIEVESGSRSIHPEELLNKKKLYEENFDNWVIVVPNATLKLKYEKMLNMKGKVIIKTELDSTLNDFLESESEVEEE